MRISKRTARVVRLAVSLLNQGRWPSSVSAHFAYSDADLLIAREVIRRDTGRRVRANGGAR